MPSVIAVVVAAGVGARMNSVRPKQYIPFSDGRCPLEISVSAFAAASSVSRIIVAVSPGDSTAASFDLGTAEVWPTGGSTRSETVMQTLERLQQGSSPDDLVLVHDAARPLVTPGDIDGLVARVLSGDCSGAVLAIPVADTVMRVDGDGFLEKPVERRGLVRVATPQAFRLGELLMSMRRFPGQTDESTAVRLAGGRVLAAACSPSNFKITEPGDFIMADRLLSGAAVPMVSQLRVGTGYDSHRLKPGRKLIMGGIEIPAEKGLDGHSDADVLLHAITDALLGAAGMGNIGILFPPSDQKYRGADSSELLAEAWSGVRSRGWNLVNIDSVVVAEAPKLNPYVPAMQRSIAKILGVSAELVSVKPKTNEKMGFEGAGEGISVRAVALLQRSQ